MSKKCPFCAEKIKDAAIKCKHCGSDLSIHPEDKTSTVTSTDKDKKEQSKKDLDNDVATYIARYKKHKKWVVGIALVMIIAFFFGVIPVGIIIVVLVGEAIAMKKNKDKIDQTVQSMIQEGEDAKTIINMLVTNGLSRGKSEEIVEYQGIVTEKNNDHPR